AELFDSVVPVTARVLLIALKMAPPVRPAWLPDRVLSLSVTVPPLLRRPALEMAPPLSVATFPDRVLPVIVSLPAFRTPPPRSARLPDTVELVSIILPAGLLKRPPPTRSAELPDTKLSVSVTVPPALAM